MKKGWTLDDVIADPVKHDELLKLALKRYQASSNYVKPWHEKFVRFFKLYDAIIDQVEDSDEPTTMIAYAYGIVENMVSAIVEPILQMRVPCRIQAKKAGQEPQAERFSSIASSYLHAPRYQLEFTESVREQIICGNAWENDAWANDYLLGRKWAKVQRTSVIDKVKGFFGLDHAMKAEAPYESIEEVPHEYPMRVGYHTRFPWIFDVYPEPGVKNVRDMHWLIEQERSVAVDDLRQKQFRDSKTKQLKPVFNFALMDQALGEHVAGNVTPQLPEPKADYGAETLQALSGQDDETAQSTEPDMDKVYLQWHWEVDRVFVVAQNRWIVGYQEDVFQVPRIPYRLRVYTPRKEFLFGKGAIEPVENQLNELNDTHQLAMRNWIRIINQMVAYDDEAIPFKDDWKPRAGGRVRVRTEGMGAVSDKIHAITQTDVTSSMLTQESNTKGLINYELAADDLSPGVEGTKQTHKTLGGLMEISRVIARRTTTIRRMILAGFQDQLWFMEKLFSQFQFEKAPFATVGPDGSTALAEFDMWDIATGGEGFEFVIEYDPSFGDDALMRNQMMALLDVSLKYMEGRAKFGAPGDEEVALAEIMRRTFKAFGWSDTSQVLRPPDGSKTPEAEFQDMLQGKPCAPQPNENLIQHLIDHTIQLNSPVLRKMIDEKKVDPKVMVLLRAHIEATALMAAQVVDNPGAAAKAKMAMMSAAAGQMSPQGSALAAVAPDQGRSPVRAGYQPRAGAPQQERNPGE